MTEQIDHWNRDVQGYGVTVTCPEEALRARVWIDFYAAQSYAVAEAWTAEHGWVEAYRLHPSAAEGVSTRARAWGAPPHPNYDRDALHPADTGKPTGRDFVVGLAGTLLAEARRLPRCDAGTRL
jgi:hypothetical protein